MKSTALTIQLRAGGFEVGSETGIILGEPVYVVDGILYPETDAAGLLHSARSVILPDVEETPAQADTLAAHHLQAHRLRFKE